MNLLTSRLRMLSIFHLIGKNTEVQSGTQGLRVSPVWNQTLHCPSARPAPNPWPLASNEAWSYSLGNPQSSQMGHPSPLHPHGPLTLLLLISALSWSPQQDSRAPLCRSEGLCTNKMMTPRRFQTFPVPSELMDPTSSSEAPMKAEEREQPQPENLVLRAIRQAEQASDFHSGSFFIWKLHQGFTFLLKNLSVS